MRHVYTKWRENGLIKVQLCFVIFLMFLIGYYTAKTFSNNKVLEAPDGDKYMQYSIMELRDKFGKINENRFSSTIS